MVPCDSQLQTPADNGAPELTKIIVLLRTKLDARSTERARLDDMFGPELRGLVQKVHKKFVEVEKAIARPLPESPKKYRVELRNWSDHTRLDLDG